MAPALPSIAAAALVAVALCQTAAAAPICDAVYRPSEKLVQKGVAAAHVAPPAIAGLQTAPIADALRGSLRRVELPPGEKLVALTFDLCETAGEIAGYDGEVFAALRADGVKATVFAGGHWMATHDTRFAELEADPLIEIANHSWSHANLRVVDHERMLREILAPQAIALSPAAAECPRADGPVPALETTGSITPPALHLGEATAGTQSPQTGAPATSFAQLVREAISRPFATHSATIAAPAPPLSTKISAAPKLFRFPFGACNPASMHAVNDAGLIAVQWDVSTGDASPFLSADAIVRDTLAMVKPGSIILAHANGRGYHTGGALPRLIAALRERGYRFVTVSELIAAGKPVITDTCYDSRPGDTDHYDSWGRKPSPALLAPTRATGAPAIAPAVPPAPANPIAPLAPVTHVSAPTASGTASTPTL